MEKWSPELRNDKKESQNLPFSEDWKTDQNEGTTKNVQVRLMDGQWVIMENDLPKELTIRGSNRDIIKKRVTGEISLDDEIIKIEGNTFYCYKGPFTWTEVCGSNKSQKWYHSEGVSRLSPLDKYNEETGWNISLGRALTTLKKKFGKKRYIPGYFFKG